MILSRVNFTYFLASFSLCLLFTYAFAPPPVVVVKFPSPTNAGKITYKDASDTCYRFRAQKEECPADASKIKEQPITEDFRSRMAVR